MSPSELIDKMYYDKRNELFKNKVEMTKEEKTKAEFDELVRPLIKWIAENQHPHTQILIDCTSAELLEGIMVLSTDEYIID